MQLLEMVDSEDWLLASWIHWQHLKFQHGAMVSDTIMESSSKFLLMDINVKFQTFG
jgi:hypothetical protein